MAWQSTSFRKPVTQPSSSDSRKISETADKHRSAMNTVVKAARKFADERRETLDQIQDPKLRRSAAR